MKILVLLIVFIVSINSHSSETSNEIIIPNNSHSSPGETENLISPSVKESGASPLPPQPAQAPVSDLSISEPPNILIDPSRLRFALILFNSFANEISFDTIYGEVGGSFFRGNLDFHTDTALGLGIEINKLKNQGWGFAIGLTFDQEREVNSLSGPGGASSLSVKPVFSVITGYYNAIYTWDRLYLPFGFNFSQMNLRSPGTPVHVTGGFGLQIGVGYVMTEAIHIDLMIRSITSSLMATDGADYINYGPGRFTGLQVNLKFLF